MKKIMKFFKNKEFEYGLVLSGGASRGFAHLGVIEALHEHHIYPEIISGASAGSIVGGFYADGKKPREVLQFFMEKKVVDFINLSFNGYGLLKIKGFRQFLEKNLKAKTFEELEKKLIIVKTNLNDGKPEYINSGDLIEAIIASSSIPALFDPIIKDKIVYVDGGVTNNFPVEPIKNACKKLIGVHVNPIGKDDNIDGIRKIALRSFHLSVASGINEKKKLFDYYIEPQELKSFGYFDIERAEEIFDIGYKEAMKVLEKG